MQSLSGNDQEEDQEQRRIDCLEADFNVLWIKNWKSTPLPRGEKPSWIL